MKKIVSAVVGLAFLALMVGCEKEPSNLIVSHVDFSETSHENPLASLIFDSHTGG
jgi:hypothetical protein